MPDTDAVAAFLMDGTSPFYRWYVAAWATACALALGQAVLDRRRLGPELAAYARFLAMPWKLAVFAPAFLFVTFAGRYAHDDTWDVVTGGGMSALTYLTAPWSVGVAWQVAHGLRPRRDIALALADPGAAGRIGP